MLIFDLGNDSLSDSLGGSSRTDFPNDKDIIPIFQIPYGIDLGPKKKDFGKSRPIADHD